EVYNVGNVNCIKELPHVVMITETEYQKVKKYKGNVRVRFVTRDFPNNVFLNQGEKNKHNPTRDHTRRQKGLILPLIIATQARHAYETKSFELLQPHQRQSVASYLAHNINTANANHVDITADNIWGIASAMARLQSPKSWTIRPAQQSDRTPTIVTEPTITPATDSVSDPDNLIASESLVKIQLLHPPRFRHRQYQIKSLVG
ncbi:hypothetical protein CHS0354_036980, partial [Potamilus streckersoni]